MTSRAKRPALTPDRPLRVALVGAGHWHAPFYGAALRKAGAELVGLTDSDPATATRRGLELHLKTYADATAIVEETQPDLIFAFAPHRDMTSLASQLLDLNTPFVIEKPTGLDWRALAGVAAKAQTLAAWAGVDLVARTHRVVSRLHALKEGGKLGQVCNFTYRLFAGDPQRYNAWGVPWMLDPIMAGAGCLFNFGPHVVDTFQWLTDEPVVEVLCHLRYLHGLAVPDYAHLTCVTPSGVVGNLEVGYICPGDFYERGLTLGSDRLYVSTPNLDAGILRWRDGHNEEVLPGDYGDDFWLGYARDVERRLRTGEPPVAKLSDMARTLRILNAAEESALSGRAVQIN